jgi:hypothetical protein
MRGEMGGWGDVCVFVLRMCCSCCGFAILQICYDESYGRGAGALPVLVRS